MSSSTALGKGRREAEREREGAMREVGQVQIGVQKWRAEDLRLKWGHGLPKMDFIFRSKDNITAVSYIKILHTDFKTSGSEYHITVGFEACGNKVSLNERVS